MQLFDQSGNRRFLTAEKRQTFLPAAKVENPENRLFFHPVYHGDCRPTEALELTAESIFLEEKEIFLRIITKRKSMCPFSRASLWRLLKRVVEREGNEGKQARILSWIRWLKLVEG
jgi:hypothetical protein